MPVFRTSIPISSQSDVTITVDKVRTDTTILVHQTRYRYKLGGSFCSSRYTLPIRPNLDSHQGRIGRVELIFFPGIVVLDMRFDSRMIGLQET